MTESGVIPRTQERSSYVRELGRVTDMDGVPLRVGVDHDAVTIGTSAVLFTLTLSQVEDLAHVLVAAVWEAGRNTARMAGDMKPP